MRRKLQGGWARAAKIIAVLYTLFQLGTAGIGLLPDIQQRAVHVAFGFVLTFMLFTASRQSTSQKRVPVLDIVIILLILASAVNTYVKYEWFMVHVGESTTLDLFLGSAIILISLEGARRVVGWVFPIFTALMILYSLFGKVIPGGFGHRGIRLEYMIQALNQTGQGVWGFVTGISASLLAVFLIFGAFLLFTGGGETFMLLSIRLAGRLRGGPALVGVIGSGLFGMISGSAVANIVTIGNFTIPMMKRLGYRAEFAGGVEATASSGGQIMPPIMGAGAFIMAEILSIPYIKIALYAAIPAILYYLTVFLSVRFEAIKTGLAPVPDDQIPSWKSILTWQRLAPLFLPIAILLYFLLTGWSATRAGFWACISTLVLYFLSDVNLAGMKKRFGKIIYGLEQGGLSIVSVLPLLVCANIVIALINVSGLGVKFSEAVMGAAGTSLLLALLFAALVALVLGMGMPTTGAYLLAAAVCGPALVKLGFAPIVAHLFLFYFAIISAITPPVCVAAFAGAALAEANWLKVALVAMRLSIVAFFVPFFFAYNPSLVMIGSPLDIAISFATACLGTVFIAAGTMGYLTFAMSIPARIVLFAGGVLLVFPSITYSLIGAALVAIGIVAQWWWNRMRARTA